MAVVSVEECHTFHDPGVEAAGNVFEDLEYHVPPIAQPREFGPRRRGPNRLFTFFALITELHAGPER